MIQENAFDEVHDCQEIFRRLLEAFANPGKIVSIAAQAEIISDRAGTMLALARTLLDQETLFTVVDDDLLAQTFAETTYASKEEQQANFIFVTQPCEPERIRACLAKAFPGTLVEPQRSSTLLITVPEYSNTRSVRLKGPGVKGSRPVGLTDYAQAWVTVRDQMGYEYPMGIDLLFVTPAGELMAIPRKITMEGCVS